MNNISELSAILEKATQNSLVIFDIDEVIVYPKNIVQLQVASPFWEASMTDFEQRLGKSTRDLLHSIMLLQTQWELTDRQMPQLINDLQLKKIRVLALTSFRRGELGRIPSVENWRTSQLKKHDIDFSLTASLAQNHLEIHPLKSDPTKRPVYKDGIIYTDLHSKSEVLSIFLKNTNLNPKEIIFIDDRLSNVQDLENFCKSAKIQFIGIHDTRIMKRFDSFNKPLGTYQFRYLENFHTWLSDAKATTKMAEHLKNRSETITEHANK